MSAGRKRGINSSGHRPPDKAPAPFNDTIAAIITPPGEGGIAAVRIAGELSRGILAKHFRPMASPRSRRLAPFHMRFGHFVKTGEAAAREVIVDEVMAVYMPEGKSYTGLEQVEIYCHGGRRVVREILNRILLSGARAAEPGEFTRLAFLSGRIDLAHAEAVAEIIAADTNTSYQSARDHLIGRYSKHLEQLREQLVAVIAEVEASIDFPDEELDTANTSKLTLAVDGIITKTAELAQSYQGGRILREGYRVVIAGRPNSGKSSLFNLLRVDRA
jgi:tRNA modification GTPase